MAKVLMEFDADEAKLVRGFMSIENRQKALEDRTARITEKSKALTDSAKRGHDDWSDSALSVATRYVTITAAIGLATKALADMNAERKKGAELASESARAIGNLGQLAATPAELQRMRHATEISRVQEGMTAEEAGKLQFGLEAAGKADQRKAYARLYGITDPTAMLENITAIQGAFGRPEAGVDRQVMDKLMASATKAKRDVSQFGGAAAGLSKLAAAIGGTDEEMYAVLGQLSKGERTPETAAAELGTFITAAIKAPGITTGKGIMDVVRQVGARTSREAGIRKILGGKGVSPYLVYEELKKARAEVEAEEVDLAKIDQGAAAGITDYTGERVSTYREVFGGERVARQTEQLRQIAQERKLGPAELSRQARANAEEAVGLFAGVSGPARWVNRRIREAMDFVGVSPGMPELHGQSGVDVQNNVPATKVRVIIDDGRNPPSSQVE